MSKSASALSDPLCYSIRHSFSGSYKGWTEDSASPSPKEEHKISLQYLPSLSCMFALAPRPKRKTHSSTLLIWAAKIKGVAPS